MSGIFILIKRYCYRRTINYFALIAISLSICALITVNAVMKGFGEELKTLFRGSMAETLIEWSWSPPTLVEIKDKLDPICVWSPALNGFGMIKTTRYVSAIQLKGIDPEAENKLLQAMTNQSLNFKSLMEKKEATETPINSMLSLFGENSIIHKQGIMIGHLLANDLNIKVGDQVKLIVPNWQEDIKQSSFDVVHIFKSGVYEDDQSKVFIHIDNAQNLLNKPNGFSSIQCHLSLNRQNNKLLQDTFPSAKVFSWKDKFSVRLKAMAHERQLIVVVMSLIIIVFGFGILAIQWSFVSEKINDIGILRSMGFSSLNIFMIFLGVSWLIGILGIILGSSMGLLLCNNLNEILNVIGLSIFPKDVYYHDGLPVLIDKSDLLFISLFSLFVTTIAGFIPALKAMRIQPIRAITSD